MPGFVNRRPQPEKKTWWDWRERRACRTDPDRWVIAVTHQEQTTGVPKLSPANIEARQICFRDCPVSNRCLIDAYLSHADGLIQGGEVMTKGRQCSKTDTLRSTSKRRGLM